MAQQENGDREAGKVREIQPIGEVGATCARISLLTLPYASVSRMSRGGHGSILLIRRDVEHGACPQFNKMSKNGVCPQFNIQ